MKSLVFALIFAAAFAHAELNPIVAIDGQQTAPAGLDLTGLELNYVEAYATCTIGSGKSQIDYSFDVERYSVIDKADAKQPCQLIYTKNGVSSIKAWAKNVTPEKCYEVAERVMLKLEAAGATCGYAQQEQY